MRHFTIDGFQGSRSRFDDIAAIREALKEIPGQLGLRPAMPPFVLPYYNGLVPADGGVSAFLFLEGGHFSVHTFSFRHVYFSDLVARRDFDARRLEALLDKVLPCGTTVTNTIDRRDLRDTEHDVATDFGPHLFLDIDGYRGPRTLDQLFALFDKLPREIGMTPIMRPYVIRDAGPDGREVLSAMTMIAESHITLHVYPDEHRAYFDVFSCRFFSAFALVPRLRAYLPGTSVREALIARGRNYRFLRTQAPDEQGQSRASRAAALEPTGPPRRHPIATS
jgi:S-adenosylmethionine/arginine decarboxylase-like enzyme